MRLELRAARLTEAGVAGEVIALDGPYGNLITNLPPQAGLESVVVAGKRIAVMRTYEDADESGLVAAINSYDLLEVSARSGSAAAVLGVQTGEPVERGDGG